MLGDDLQSLAERLSAARAEGLFRRPGEIVHWVARLNAASAEAHALQQPGRFKRRLAMFRETAVLAFFAALPWLRIAWGFLPWR